MCMCMYYSCGKKIYLGVMGCDMLKQHVTHCHITKETENCSRAHQELHQQENIKQQRNVLHHGLIFFCKEKLYFSILLSMPMCSVHLCVCHALCRKIFFLGKIYVFCNTRVFWALYDGLIFFLVGQVECNWEIFGGETFFSDACILFAHNLVLWVLVLLFFLWHVLSLGARNMIFVCVFITCTEKGRPGCLVTGQGEATHSLSSVWHSSCWCWPDLFYLILNREGLDA